jgi:hypothetical protein
VEDATLQESETYSYADLGAAAADYPTMTVPVGRQFKTLHDPRFVANPYLIRDTTSTAYLPASSDTLYEVDTERLLLNDVPCHDPYSAAIARKAGYPHVHVYEFPPSNNMYTMYIVCNGNSQ